MPPKAAWEQSAADPVPKGSSEGQNRVSFLPAGFVAAPSEASRTVGSLCQDEGSCAPRKPGLKVSALVTKHKMNSELPGSAGEKGNRMHSCSLLAG